MKRDKHGLIVSHLDRARRHPGRSEASHTVHASIRRGPSKRVPGALAGTAHGNDLRFGNDPMVAAEVIGESHGAGLSVVWTVLCGHRQPAQPR